MMFKPRAKGIIFYFFSTSTDIVLKYNFRVVMLSHIFISVKTEYGDIYFVVLKWIVRASVNDTVGKVLNIFQNGNI